MICSGVLMNKITLTLPGSIRSKKNSKIPTIVGGVNKPRRAIILPSQAYQKWEKIAAPAAKIQYPHSEPIISPVCVRAIAYIRGIEPDLSGMTESVGDCLEKAEIIKNDRQIKSWDGSRVYRDKDNPRTIVEITPFDDGQKKLFSEV